MSTVVRKNNETVPVPPSAPPDRSVLDLLQNLQKRVLWLSTQIIHHANFVRDNPDALKVGGHQASSASLVSLMTALYFQALRPGDVVSVKPPQLQMMPLGCLLPL